MELIQEKGQEEPTLVNSEDVQAVANPHIIQIENNQ